MISGSCVLNENTLYDKCVPFFGGYQKNECKMVNLEFEKYTFCWITS